MYKNLTTEEALDKLTSLQQTTSYCSFHIGYDNNKQDWIITFFNARPTKTFRDSCFNKVVCNAYQYVITNRKRKNRKPYSDKFKKEFTL